MAFFHFTNGNPTFLPAGALKSVGSYGWAGVEAFFVISGFVIPLALIRSRYRLKNFGVFIARRVVRLDPPYLVSVAIVVMLFYLSAIAPGYSGEPFDLSWRRLLLHVGYLNDIAGVPWYNDVYWTLAIELQFYLLVGLVFPVIASRSRYVPTLALAALGAVAFAIDSNAIVFAFIFPFVMGMLVFRYRTGALNQVSFLIQLAIASAGTFVTLGMKPFLAAITAALAIAYVSFGSHRVLAFLGAISYSLYLLHVPIGGRVINLAARLDLGIAGKVAAIAAAALASIGAAYVLYRFVELPALRWARKLNWSPR